MHVYSLEYNLLFLCFNKAETNERVIPITMAPVAGSLTTPAAVEQKK